MGGAGASGTPWVTGETRYATIERTAPGAESFIYAGDVLHGTELAQRIIEHIVHAQAAERALVLQMPGWDSRTPSTPAAVAVMRGNYFHILAVVDTWNVLPSPPPSLARFAKEIRWSYEGGDDVAIAAALGELSKTWWAEAADDVGTIEIGRAHV